MTTVAFQRNAPVQIAKGGPLGLYFAWGAFAKVDGEPFVDAHGDIIPEDDLVAGAVGLAKSNTLKLEHSGGARGEVPLVMPLTTDIKAALGIESPNSGLVVGFRPDVELAKAIDAGEIIEMSIAGRALAELAKAELAKGADGAPIAKAEHKRTLRQLEIDEISLVKRAAHGAGTRIAIAKRADASPAEVAKRAPAMTDPTNGHQHLIYDAEEADGGTSYEVMPGAEYGHSHPWVRLADGSVSIGMVAGHTHSLANPETATMADDLAKSLTAAQADVTKARGLITTAVALPLEQLAFAKRLDATALETFLARPDAERATIAAPIHKSERTGRVFFKGEEALVELSKDADATHAELAKARNESQTATIAKAVAAVPLVKGAGLIVKALHGGQLTDAERFEALADLATINASLAVVTKHVGSGGGGPVENDADPKVVIEKAAVAFIKSNPTLSAIEARREFGRSEEGQRLYAAAYPLG